MKVKSRFIKNLLVFLRFWRDSPGFLWIIYQGTLGYRFSQILQNNRGNLDAYITQKGLIFPPDQQLIPSWYRTLFSRIVSRPLGSVIMHIGHICRIITEAIGLEACIVQHGMTVWEMFWHRVFVHLLEPGPTPIVMTQGNISQDRYGQINFQSPDQINDENLRKTEGANAIILFGQ